MRECKTTYTQDTYIGVVSFHLCLIDKWQQKHSPPPFLSIQDGRERLKIVPHKSTHALSRRTGYT